MDTQINSINSSLKIIIYFENMPKVFDALTLNTLNTKLLEANIDF